MMIVKNPQKKAGDQIADSEVSSWKCRNLERDILFKLVQDSNEPILEIGPGYGRLMARLISSGIKDITGVELSENLSKIQKERGFNSIVGNVVKIPLSDDSFNTVILEQVIEHVVDQERAMSEIYRILNCSGKLILSTPNKYIYRGFMYISNLINRQWSLKLIRNPTPGHVAECSLKRLIELHKDFCIDKIIPINPYLPKNLLNLFPQLAINYVVVSHKE